MALEALSTPRFIRKTQLGANEYRKNFHQIDADVIAAVASTEADRITPLMSKIYLRLVSAPPKFWERQGVLRFETQAGEGNSVTGWAQLCDLLGVASATAHKALSWMHEVGVIGYFAGKNGVGIRIFINRAAASVGTRAQHGQKILTFSPASSGAGRTSEGETPFNDSFAVSEVLDTDMNPRAPKSGAEQSEVVKTEPAPHPPLLPHASQPTASREETPMQATPLRVEVPVDEIVSRLSRALGPPLQAAAHRAAVLEHERTREWLERRGLPKAARVAQREAYNVLRKYGVIKDTTKSTQADVGRARPTQESRQLSDGEVEEMAQACVAMLEVKGQSVELTLSEMSAEAGGFLLPEDAPRVRQKVESLLDKRR